MNRAGGPHHNNPCSCLWVMWIPVVGLRRISLPSNSKYFPLRPPESFPKSGTQKISGWCCWVEEWVWSSKKKDNKSSKMMIRRICQKSRAMKSTLLWAMVINSKLQRVDWDQLYPKWSMIICSTGNRVTSGLSYLKKPFNPSLMITTQMMITLPSSTKCWDVALS